MELFLEQIIVMYHNGNLFVVSPKQVVNYRDGVFNNLGVEKEEEILNLLKKNQEILVRIKSNGQEHTLSITLDSIKELYVTYQYSSKEALKRAEKLNIDDLITKDNYNVC